MYALVVQTRQDADSWLFLKGSVLDPVLEDETFWSGMGVFNSSVSETAPVLLDKLQTARVTHLSHADDAWLCLAGQKKKFQTQFLSAVDADDALLQKELTVGLRELRVGIAPRVKNVLCDREVWGMKERLVSWVQRLQKIESPEVLG